MMTLPSLTLPILLAPVDVEAQYRYLCTSSPIACTYTGPNAPGVQSEALVELGHAST
jgi:hypothetical protein